MPTLSRSAIFDVILSFFAVIVMLGATTAQAQTAVPAAQATGVAPAPHYRVDEGVFGMRPGQSIDLTDRQILLTFVGVNQRANGLTIRLNGARRTAYVGERIDFLKDRRMRDIVQGMGRCYLDVLNLRTARGAPPTASFRINCI
ncbi:MAG: hypothetical protein AAFR55_01340 [Pseudomonadota bacterium]